MHFCGFCLTFNDLQCYFQLVASNEELKKQVEATQSTNSEEGRSPEDTASQEEIRRLQAENAALQKNLKGIVNQLSYILSWVVRGSSASSSYDLLTAAVYG